MSDIYVKGLLDYNPSSLNSDIFTLSMVLKYSMFERTDGCQEWKRTSRKLTSTTGLWTEMGISTGDSSSGLTICLLSSCVSPQEK